MTKAELRKQIRLLKQQYTAEELKTMSQHAIQRMEAHPSFIASQTVLLYHSLADEVGVLGGEFSGFKSCNDADESRVSFDVVAPMILTQAEAENIVKLSFGAGQLDVSHHMWLCLLVQEPVVAVTLYVS